MTEAKSSGLPLEGITALDFGHTVMGPSCTMILADLGVDVIKIEPMPDGEPTRHLKGFGTGYFGYFNRNKRSLAINLKSERGREVACRFADRADVVVENFAPGTMERLGLSERALKERNPRLIYASLKGFLDGPYAKRLALDEVVQMMGGLAYMTGPRGKPLRAGASVVDITGGMFAVIAILVALLQRKETGKGMLVQSALFESTIFLMGQHLCYAAQSSEPVPPMPERVSAWAVYETFTLSDGQQLFVGITTDNHWRRFCEAFGRADLLDDSELTTNNQRIAARPKLIPLVRAMFKAMDLKAAIEKCEEARLPFAPIAHPEELFDDPHLKATGGLMRTRLPNGTVTKLPKLPVAIEGIELSIRRDPPKVGENSIEVLAEHGFDDTEIRSLLADGIVADAGWESNVK